MSAWESSPSSLRVGAGSRQVLRQRWRTRLRSALESARTERAIVLLGVLLLLPSLDTGLAADDYLHTVMLDRPSPIAGFQRAPLDIFRFCDPRFAPALLEEGLFSWWDDPQTKVAFMRPFTALTHVIDHGLFRNVGWALHLHSVLWSALLLFGVAALYREVIGDRLLRHVALALYALDDARGWLVSWVAARNAPIATAFSVWALTFHLRGRSDPSRALRAASLLAFALALLSGEGAIAIGGYLLAAALFLEQGPLPARFLRLWPHLLAVVVWRVFYKLYDFGVSGSSVYIDPLHDPIAFLKVLLEHGPILLGSQVGGMWSDVWTMLFVVPRVRIAVWIGTLALLGWLAWALWPQWRRQRGLFAFAGTGMLLSVVPASLTLPADRMLTWIALGGSVLVASAIAALLRGGALQPRFEITASILLAAHLLGVPFLPSRARANELMRNWFDRSEAGVPNDAAIADKTLIYVNPPLLPFGTYPMIERAGLGIPRPKALRILATGVTPLTIERLDLQTLRLRPRDGFLLDPVSRLMWTEHHAFHPGQVLRQGDLRVTIVRTTADGRPLEVEMHFDRELEDASYVWRNWQGTHTGAFAPPKVGARTVLSGAEYIQSILGVTLPIEARL